MATGISNLTNFDILGFSALNGPAFAFGGRKGCVPLRLEALFIDRFRSIDHVEIRDCEPFNVLIGKNNSGKSNILSAIDAFFKVLQEGELLTIKSPIAKVVDFHDQEMQPPVSVTVRFLLDDHTNSELLSNVVSDAPQMRNAIETLRTFSKLRVTVMFTPPHAKALLTSRPSNWARVLNSQRQIGFC